MIKLNLRKTALVGIAAGAAVGLVVTSAFAAAPTYKITAGSKTSGTTTYNGKTTGSPGVRFNDQRSGLATTCTSATAAGVMKLGPSVSGTGAGTITKTTWVNCQGPTGLGLVLTPKQTQTWTINGIARPVNGVTKVFIGAVKAHITTNIGCVFDVLGSVDGTYTNATGKLAVKTVATSTHKLKAANVNSSCLGQVQNGDVLSFVATYAVTTPTGAIKIS